jgi:hypothetical protein
LWLCKDGLPPRLLVLKPAPSTLPVGGPRGSRAVVHPVAEPLAPRTHPPARALAGPVPHGVERRAPRLAHRGRDGPQGLRELAPRVAPAAAHADARTARPQTLGRAVPGSGEAPCQPVRRLVLGGRPVNHTIGLGQSPRPGFLRIAAVPEPAAPAQGGQLHLRGETATVLLVGQAVDRPWQPAPRQPHHHALLPQHPPRR